MSSKITIKRSMTASPPAGLSFGEMAFVQGSGNTSNQLYVGLSGSSPVWVGAGIENTVGDWTSQTKLATQAAINSRISALISGGSPITTVSDNTNTTRYVVFSTGATTSATLFVDDNTTALSYNPSTAILTLAGDLNVNGGDISTTQTTASLFSSTVTNLGIGLAATTLNIGASNGDSTVKSSTLTVGSSGLTGTIFADDANLILTTKNYSGGSLDPSDSSAKIIINDNIGQGFVNIEGGDLRLGNKTLEASVSGVDLIFEGTTDNTNELTLTAGNPGADYTVTLPHATDTLVGKATSDVFTNKTFDTAGTGNVFRINAIPINAVTGTGSAAVLSVSPAITTSLTTPSSTFALLNSTATTVNFAGAATALNMGVLGGTATFAGAVTVAGDLTVNGTTTTINSTTLTVDDKNIEMGSVAVPSNTTADGGGITLKGTTDKTIIWDNANNNFTSSENWNLPTGKVFKINNVSVLSSAALGSGITGSSLTQVGTITSGTWQGTAITDTYLATISTALKVSNSATTATSANTASAIVARDASGNFTAGIITGSTFSGNALTATTATTATNIVATEQTTGTIFLVGVAAASSSTGLLVNATPSTALTYDVATGELSATLIDGGSF